MKKTTFKQNLFQAATALKKFVRVHERALKLFFPSTICALLINYTAQNTQQLVHEFQNPQTIATAAETAPVVNEPETKAEDTYYDIPVSVFKKVFIDMNLSDAEILQACQDMGLTWQEVMGNIPEPQNLSK